MEYILNLANIGDFFNITPEPNKLHALTELININLERNKYEKMLTYVNEILKYKIIYINENNPNSYKAVKLLTDSLFKIYVRCLFLFPFLL